ncbi:hypothetical protein DM860_013236 [Cuscuta australis]|uniref:Protein WEAK CHLOROPLAST MOVEMENT UNDER BLUE LIGHT 1 n=1 Tax=Cuscuta australis TaxID=267555 RepID=A0A328DSZ1_9ASTE|nr:hypothetical protein DM860_013236 [Cuscuta australis]
MENVNGNTPSMNCSFDPGTAYEDNKGNSSSESSKLIVHEEKMQQVSTSDSSKLEPLEDDEPEDANGTFDQRPHIPMALPSNSTAKETEGDNNNGPETTTWELSKNSPSSSENAQTYRVQIDTTAPFESVKEAVSKFGGIVDWKAHRAQTSERRKFIDQELGKVLEEIPLLKKQGEAAEEEKMQVLEDLDSTKRAVEELKLSLERAHTEEQQARQDFELTRLRVEEIEQGIADEASIAGKAQLEVAKARHKAAVLEMETVRAELEQLRADYSLLVSERDEAVKRAEEAVYASKEIEKTVEDLTIEAITLKEALEAAHASHMETEEHRLGAALAREENILNWEKQVREAGEEVEKAKQQIQSAKDLKSNLETASALLLDLKSQFSTYMDSKLPESEEDGPSEISSRTTRMEMQAAADSARRELEEVKHSIEKAMAEVNALRVAADLLRSKLETEKSELFAIQQREGMASIAVLSLETELKRTVSEVSLARTKEKEARERLAELPKQLQEAAKEADLAKSLAETARDELRKAEEEAEQAKAGARTMESRLLAAQKEIEAAKASERLALSAINALQESQSGGQSIIDGQDSPNLVTLPLDEYYELSKQAHEAEEEANRRIAASISQIEVAKECELKSLKKLEEVNREKSERKEALRVALEKAEKAKQGKLAVEQELRRWRAEHEQRRKANESVTAPVNRTISPILSFADRKESKADDNNGIEREEPYGHQNNSMPYSSPEVKTATKKKKSFFPRFFMFFTRKKLQSKTA